MAETSKYKHTIFLPKTNFKMRGDLAAHEPLLLEKWINDDLYGQLRNQSSKRPKWTLHWGPPYANGNIHIGHALSETLKDILNKFNQMMGYDASLIPGWDCHGLPIEWKVEETFGTPTPQTALEFRSQCEEFSSYWVRQQSDSLQRLGIIADWQRPYLTSEPSSEAVIVNEIHKFLKKGALHRKQKTVLWSVAEKTALAEAETENKTVELEGAYVQFPVIDAALLQLVKTSFLVWTTTPWTLPANRALAFNPNIEYGLYQVSRHQAYILAVNCVSRLTAEGVDVGRFIRTLEPHEMSGLMCTTPLPGIGTWRVPVLEAEFVNSTAGTGLVHIAPAHGQEDFEFGCQHGLEAKNSISASGNFDEDLAIIGGKSALDVRGVPDQGNRLIFQELTKSQNLVLRKVVQKELPLSWRSKARLVHRLTPQWFVELDGKGRLRDKALDAVETVKWVPKAGKNRMLDMVSKRPDWCISRQRYWGVPLAFFVDKTTGEPLTDPLVLENIRNAIADEGSNAWWTYKSSDFLTDSYPAEEYEKVFDIVDVWFESGSTHAIVLEGREDTNWPADLYLEGTDQHRGWFQASLLEACHTRDQAPYKTVMTHGFVLDDHGHKMSKSIGNVVDPLEAIAKFGADVVRLWAASSDHLSDVRIGESILHDRSQRYRKIRNTFRFLLGSLEGFKPNDACNRAMYRELPELERLMLHKLSVLDHHIAKCVEANNIQSIANELMDFCQKDLSALYFDIRKDRLYCDDTEGFEWKACRTVLWETLNALVRWMAPILSFTAEEVWKQMHRFDDQKCQSVHMEPLWVIPRAWRDPKLSKKWDKILEVRANVIACVAESRQAGDLGSSLEAHPHVYCPPQLAEVLSSVDMAEVTVTSAFDVRVGMDDQVKILVERAQGKRCSRSWKISPDVGSDPDYPDLSPRDAAVVRLIEVRQAARLEMTR